ncbi:MAG: hypothetical protein CL840_19470 [Crocinitomicaceae bacterium]|nr:hypothetical protein [Crocinitomicaceae bacterium]|tara:strand:+ start:15853 stop:16479 length:627 start_codon:yes stop_codon:yes gene_type:complete
MTKHEWRKKEKGIYLPKARPETIDVPNFKFLTIHGEGNPNSEHFVDYVTALYALSYGIKMSAKKGMEPPDYFDYTVYPLEGVWDITDEAKKVFDGTINKDDLVFTLMIRQPDFVENDFVETIREITLKKKPLALLRQVLFEEIEEGKCVQMLHNGSYNNEPESFAIMEEYAETNGLKRLSKIHREIYLTDARKVAPEKLKTVLRFKVE